MKGTLIAVSLGSNEGDRELWLGSARKALGALSGTRIVRESRVRETEPVDVPAEFRDMKFLNQVVLLETTLEVHEFSRLMHGIEDDLGRVRTVRNGPRNIDIDLIFFGDEVLDEPGLAVPHPRAKSRAFVMEPLREVMGLRSWAAFLRLPNIGTAFGDAIAGAVVAALSTGSLGGRGGLLAWSSSFGWREVLGASLAAAFLYLFGLADNDIVDKARDEAKSPLRPLASGLIGINSAIVARAALLAVSAAFWSLAVWGQSPVSALPFAAVAILVILYNRIKTRLPLLGIVVMGLCRGAAVMLGAFAALGADGATPAVVLMAGGWTAYISAVTLLGLNEESASRPLGGWRYLGAITAFMPLLAFIALPPEVPQIVPSMCIPLIGALAAAATWMAAVAPLGAEHGPQERGRAVGMAVSALVYLQVGFILTVAIPSTALAAGAVWLVSRMVRRLSSRFVPQVTGS